MEIKLENNLSINIITHNNPDKFSLTHINSESLSSFESRILSLFLYHSASILDAAVRDNVEINYNAVYKKIYNLNDKLSIENVCSSTYLNFDYSKIFESRIVIRNYNQSEYLYYTKDDVTIEYCLISGDFINNTKLSNLRAYCNIIFYNKPYNLDLFLAYQNYIRSANSNPYIKHYMEIQEFCSQGKNFWLIKQNGKKEKTNQAVLRELLESNYMQFKYKKLHINKEYIKTLYNAK